LKRKLNIVICILTALEAGEYIEGRDRS